MVIGVRLQLISLRHHAGEGGKRQQQTSVPGSMGAVYCECAGERLEMLRPIDRYCSPLAIPPAPLAARPTNTLPAIFPAVRSNMEGCLRVKRQAAKPVPSASQCSCDPPKAVAVGSVGLGAICVFFVQQV